MKLLLTSDGLSSVKIKKAFVELLEKNLRESKVLIVHTAQKPAHLVFVEEIKKEISKIGILPENINYLNMAKEEHAPSLKSYDVIYVCGGNTYFILDRIKKIGLDKALKKYVKSGKLYIGVSAGSILAGKDISIAGWGSEGDVNEVHLKDLNGLGFVDFATFPHYENKLKKEVDSFRLSVKYPVETLKDGEALLITGKKLRVN